MTLSEFPVAADSSGEVPAATGPDPWLVLFCAYGTPAPQGSKKAFVRGGRAALVESSAKVKPWREAVKTAALDWRDEHGRPTLDGPLLGSMTFTLRKPTSAPKRRRVWPTKYPDLSKLLRCTEDAITDAGLWADDARVVEYQSLRKLYVGDDGALDTPGVVVAIRALA